MNVSSLSAWPASIKALALATLLVMFGCEVTSSGSSTECDPADDAGCVCLDDITQTACAGPDANNCTCSQPGAAVTPDASGEVVDDRPVTADVVPQPTSIDFDRSQPNGSAEYHAWLCLADQWDPFAGFTLEATYPAQCGDANVILGFTVLGADTSLVYVGTSGVFSISSASAGENGEGPFPGTTAHRLSSTGTTTFTLSSVVLKQDTYRLDFELVLSLDGSTPKVQIDEIVVTRNQ